MLHICCQILCISISPIYSISISEIFIYFQSLVCCCRCSLKNYILINYTSISIILISHSTTPFRVQISWHRRSRSYRSSKRWITIPSFKYWINSSWSSKWCNFSISHRSSKCYHCSSSSIWIYSHYIRLCIFETTNRITISTLCLIT